jgi:ABC-type transport system substrate-binding protein
MIDNSVVRYELGAPEVGIELAPHLHSRGFFLIIKISPMSRQQACLLFLPAVLLAALMAVPQDLSAAEAAEVPHRGGTLRVKALSDDFWPSLDPAKDSQIFVMEQIYDGLVRLDQDLNVLSSLAESWVISKDGRKSVFYLRKGVRFHHGKELDADDVKFSLERLVNKKTAGAFCQYFTSKVVGAQEYYEGKAQDVEGFIARDKYTFEIQWLYPYVSALYLLSMNFCKIVPRDLVLSQGKDFFFRPSGTGPFKFAYWLRSPKLDIVGVRLERNKDYFGKKPYLEALEFSPYYTLDHFLEKQIDIIPYISERLAETDCQVLGNDTFSTFFLGMSCHIPPLDRPSVRKALSLGIDKKEIAKAAFRFDTVPLVTNNYIPAKLRGFFPANDEGRFDPEKAKAILGQEGYSEANELPALNIFFPQPRQEEDPKVYRVLRDELAVLGLKTRMKYYQPGKDLSSSSEPYLVIVGWMMDYPDPENIVLPVFSSSSAVNLSLLRYSSPRLDELIKQAEIEPSWRARIALFHKIEDILNADIPAVPLFSRQQRLALQPYVMGAKIPPLGFLYLDAKEIWLAE